LIYIQGAYYFMKKISFIIPSFKTGGGNRVFIELANILAEDHIVEIIYPNNSIEVNTFNVNQEIKLISVGQSSESKLIKIFNIIKTFSFVNKHCSNSYVITSDPLMGLLGFLLTISHKYRFVQADDYKIFDDNMIIKSRLLLKFYKKATKLSYKYRFSYIFNSQYTFQAFKDVYPDFNGAAPIVHPAINPKIFNVTGRKTAEIGKKTICLVARKHPWKGLQTFINVWNTLPNNIKKKIGKVRLISHDDLSFFDTADFEVITPKNDKDIADVFRQSDIFISTSWWEGFGLPPLEAMACGCAIITSRSGGVNEYAIDGFNCIMFPPQNEQKLQKAIIELIENTTFCKRLSDNAILTSTKFNWNSSAKQLTDILGNTR